MNATETREGLADEEVCRERDDVYRLLAVCSEDFMALHHIDGRRLYLSPSYWQVTGWAPEDVQATDWRTRVHPDDLPAVERMREANLRGESTVVEHRTRCKDGSWLWLETRCRPLPGLDGKVDRMMLWSRNISERKAAEAKQESLQNQLFQAQKMEAVGRLAGGVAHDFNNMLQTIMATTELMLNDRELNERQISDLQEIAKAARRSADLTRQLLAFASRQTISPKRLDLNEAVSEALKMLRRLIGENVELVWTPGDGVWLVNMDPVQIDQMLANLMINARDMITGSGKVTVRTGHTVLDADDCRDHPDLTPGDYVTLTVSDDGCGMDREALARVFEPFFTVKGDVKINGGLGLATVYGIVKQNRGIITAASEPGKGSTFTICLPRRAESDGETDLHKDVSAPLQKGAVTVLLVEDEASLLRLVQRLLETLGYHVLSASGPQEALCLAAEHTGAIHVLVSDMVMPEMDGCELRRRLEAVRPGMKCLFMSGYPDDVIAQCGVLEKGVHLLQKPFLRPALDKKLREVLADAAD